ncbi:hypothetical protein [Shigella sonnei]|uniref:hypothetical protein n=1 Tax=Shigella sonnei TaxID=624 RepID=UPI0020B44052|nr:hypothetical protein [Shigella sonnei]
MSANTAATGFLPVMLMECDNAENPQGWKPNYFAGSVATYDAIELLIGFYDDTFHKDI